MMSQYHMNIFKVIDFGGELRKMEIMFKLELPVYNMLILKNSA